MKIWAIVAAVFISTQCMAETESVGVFGGHLQLVLPQNNNSKIVPFLAGGLGSTHNSFGAENSLRISIGGGIKNLISKKALIETGLYFTRINETWPINVFGIQQSIGLLTGDGNIQTGVSEYQISLLFQTLSQNGDSGQEGNLGLSYGYYATDFLRLGFQYTLIIMSD